MLTEGAAEEGTVSESAASATAESSAGTEEGANLESGSLDAAQTSVPGNVGFGKTGQQPDSIGDHPQAGTGAPVDGASGGNESSGTSPKPAEEEDKSAESVVAAS